MKRDDALKILELAESHTLAQLKTAYREALLVWHPDRFETGTALHQKATFKTQQINDAHRILISSRLTIIEPDEPRAAPAEQPSVQNAKPRATPPPISKSPPVPPFQASRGKHIYMVGDDDFFCCRCGELYFGDTKKTFLGLRQFRCLKCDHKNEFPPSSRFIGCCWLIASISVVMIIAVFSSGGFAFPGLIGFSAIASLLSAYNTKAYVKRALKFHRLRNSIDLD